MDRLPPVSNSNNWKTPLVITLSVLGGAALIAGAVFAASYSGHGIHSMHGTLAGRVSTIVSFVGGAALVSTAVGVQCFNKRRRPAQREADQNEASLNNPVEAQRHEEVSVIDKFFNHFNLPRNGKEIRNVFHHVTALATAHYGANLTPEVLNTFRASYCLNNNIPSMESLIRDESLKLSLTVYSLDNDTFSQKVYVNGLPQTSTPPNPDKPAILMANGQVIAVIIQEARQGEAPVNNPLISQRSGESDIDKLLNVFNLSRNDKEILQVFHHVTAVATAHYCENLTQENLNNFRDSYCLDGNVPSMESLIRDESLKLSLTVYSINNGTFTYKVYVNGLPQSSAQPNPDKPAILMANGKVIAVIINKEPRPAAPPHVPSPEAVPAAPIAEPLVKPAAAATLQLPEYGQVISSILPNLLQNFAEWPTEKQAEMSAQYLKVLQPYDNDHARQMKSFIEGLQRNARNELEAENNHRLNLQKENNYKPADTSKLQTLFTPLQEYIKAETVINALVSLLDFVKTTYSEKGISFINFRRLFALEDLGRFTVVGMKGDGNCTLKAFELGYVHSQQGIDDSDKFDDLKQLIEKNNHQENLHPLVRRAGEHRLFISGELKAQYEKYKVLKPQILQLTINDQNNNTTRDIEDQVQHWIFRYKSSGAQEHLALIKEYQFALEATRRIVTALPRTELVEAKISDLKRLPKENNPQANYLRMVKITELECLLAILSTNGATRGTEFTTEQQRTLQALFKQTSNELLGILNCKEDQIEDCIKRYKAGLINDHSPLITRYEILQSYQWVGLEAAVLNIVGLNEIPSKILNEWISNYANPNSQQFSSGIYASNDFDLRLLSKRYGVKVIIYAVKDTLSNAEVRDENGKKTIKSFEVAEAKDDQNNPILDHEGRKILDHEGRKLKRKKVSSYVRKDQPSYIKRTIIKGYEDGEEDSPNLPIVRVFSRNDRHTDVLLDIKA